MKAMLDVGLKKMAWSVRAKLPGARGVEQNCSFMSLPWLQAKETVAQCVKDGFDKEGFAPKMVMGLAVEGPVCEQDKNGLDVWTMKMQNETTVAPGMTEMVSTTLSYKFDKDFLFREMSEDVKVGKVATFYGSLASEGVPEQVGPSDEDLAIDNWVPGVKCQEVPFGSPSMPPQLQPVLKAFSTKPGAAAILHHIQNQDTTLKVTKEGRRLQGSMPAPSSLPAWMACFMPQQPATTPPPAVVV